MQLTNNKRYIVVKDSIMHKALAFKPETYINHMSLAPTEVLLNGAKVADSCRPVKTPLYTIDQCVFHCSAHKIAQKRFGLVSYKDHPY